MERNEKSHELDLVQAVRGLDQKNGDSSTTTQQKLEDVWKALSSSSPGKYHAAEEMVVRWLLKNMHGDSTEAEQLRRFALSWSILGAVFARIPLFSLAKSLADRRFIVVLKQTLKSLSRPKTGPSKSRQADPDVEMVDEHEAKDKQHGVKRKRTEPAAFHPEPQDQELGCLLAAEAVFDSLQVVLARTKIRGTTSSPAERLGIEHIKSLFLSSAADALELTIPCLDICQHAFDSSDYDLGAEQSHWISVLSYIWTLHLQAGEDLELVVNHISRPGIQLLAKLKAAAKVQDTIATDVNNRWMVDLQRFLTRIFVLPIRSLYQSQKDLSLFQLSIPGEYDGNMDLYLPVLFDLVLNTPGVNGAMQSKKDGSAWAQAVFETLESAIRRGIAKNGREVVRKLVQTALAHQASLPLTTLRAAIREYALQSSRVDWKLIRLAGELDIDTYVASQGGEDLLQEVLRLSKATLLQDDELDDGASFVVALASGFTKSRNLSGFLKIWFQQLAEVSSAVSLRQCIWLTSVLREFIISSVQTAMTAQQLLSVLDWMSSQNTPAENRARIAITEVISEAINQESFVDAVETKLFDSTFHTDMDEANQTEVKVMQWNVATKTLAWTTFAQSLGVWEAVKHRAQHLLKHSSVEDEETLAAFRCCAAAWLSAYSGGSHEDTTARVISDFLNRIDESFSAGEATPQEIQDGKGHIKQYLEYILSECPRLINMDERRNGRLRPFFLRSLSKDLDSSLSAEPVVINEDDLAILTSEDVINDEALMRRIVDKAINSLFVSEHSQFSAQDRSTINLLLRAPLETIDRKHREMVLSRLVPRLSRDLETTNSGELGDWILAVSLMVKMMRKPTFYKGMKFSDLVEVSRPISAASRSLVKDAQALPDIVAAVDLLRELTTLTITQMTSNAEKREREYLIDAINIGGDPGFSTDAHHHLPRLILLKTLLLAVDSSSILRGIRELEYPTSLARQKLQAMVGETLDLCEQGVDETGPSDIRAVLLSVSLDAAVAQSRATLENTIAPRLPQLREMTASLCEKQSRFGWQARASLIKLLPSHWQLTDEINNLHLLGQESKPSENDGKSSSITSETERITQDTMARYVEAVSDNARKVGIQDCLETLLSSGVGKGEDSTGPLLAVHHLIQHTEFGKDSSAAHDGALRLASVHNLLCERLERVSSASEFLLTLETLHLLLERHGASMTQWNIEATLGTVARVVSSLSQRETLRPIPSMFDSLCRCTDAVVLHHRHRIQRGHFHLLVVVLQSLFRHLLCHPLDTVRNVWAKDSKSPGAYTQWEQNAKVLARLVTRVCEPSGTSASRSQPARLDSAKEDAKRYAGQHMYLVLMLYIKLQLEQAVPRGVRQALEPAVYAILDITTPERRRILNDGLDASGRAIMREIYKQYLKFGKWSGI